MFATCLALVACSLRSGDVVTIPAHSILVVPGKLNWFVGDPNFTVEYDCWAIVTRSQPEGVEGVVEVKLGGSVNRLGWMADTKPVALAEPAPAPRVVARVAPRLPAEQPIKDHSKEEKSYGVRVTARRRARRGHAPDFSGIDNAIAGMGGGSMYGGSYGSGGYYTGPRMPSGTYIGGVGSSHRGGHYSNAATGNHYQHGN